MNSSNSRIPKEIASDVFALASRLYHKKNQDYSLAELIQAGAEAQIPPEFIQQALQEIQQAQIQAHERQQKLKLILISGIAGGGLALGSLWAYNMLASNPASVRQSADLNNSNDMSATLPAPDQPLVGPAGVTQPYTYGASFSGKVKLYLLNPEGLVDGLMLDNVSIPNRDLHEAATPDTSITAHSTTQGVFDSDENRYNLQVTFPPHLANSLVTTVQPGDSVTVVGNPGIPSNIGQEIHAFSITNTRTQRTLINQPPAYPPPPPRNKYSNLSVEGTAQNWLVGHRGDIRGIILSSGAQVRFPPHVGDQLFNIARGGAKIQAEGFGTSTSLGQVLEATYLTVNGQPVNFYPDSSWLSKRHKKP